MASLAATAWHKPIGLVPCLSWSSATPVFTRGAMSGAISWDVLRNQYDRQVEYQAEIMKQLLICPKTDAFRLGRSFAKNFPETFENLQCVDFDIARVNKSREDSKQVAAEKSVSELDCDQEIDDGSLQKQPAEQLNGSELKQLLREGIKKKLLPANYSHMEKDKILDNVFYQKENELERSAKAQAREENQKNTRVSQSAVIGCGPGCSCYTSSCPVGENNSGTSTPRPTPNHKVRSKWGKTKHSHIDLDQEAYNFMRGVMDVCTFIGNFDVPVDTDLIISVLAKEDAYIPRDNILGLNEIWPGTEIRYIDGGHIYAALFQQHLFRKAIHDVIEKYKRKYPSNTKVKRNDR